MKQGRPQKENRNKSIVWLRKLNPNHYSFQVLGDIFELTKERIYAIWERYEDKYELPEWVDIDEDERPKARKS